MTTDLPICANSPDNGALMETLLAKLARETGSNKHASNKRSSNNDERIKQSKCPQSNCRMAAPFPRLYSTFRTCGKPQKLGRVVCGFVAGNFFATFAAVLCALCG